MLEQLLRAAGWRRLVVTGLCLAAWRGLEQIAVPGLSGNLISDRLQLVNTSDLIHAIGSGISLAPYSIVAIGITPYIYALAELANQWSPYGVNPWIDIAYVVVEIALVMGFTFFIVAVEFPSAQTPRLLTEHMNRLALIGGIFLALAVGVVPVVERIASGAAGTAFSMSGFDAVLVAAVILAVVAGLERSGATRPSLQVPATYMP